MHVRAVRVTENMQTTHCDEADDDDENNGDAGMEKDEEE